MVELLVVIQIIGVLAAIASEPACSDAKANDADAMVQPDHAHHDADLRNRPGRVLHRAPAVQSEAPAPDRAEYREQRSERDSQ